MNNEPQVWWTTTAAFRPHLVELFSDVEYQRWQRYRSGAARTHFAVGCALARLVLAELTGVNPAALVIDRRCAQCGRPHGKPRLIGSTLHFSVSHSGECVGVAVIENFPIGLDVEKVTDLSREHIVDAVLALDEARSWNALPEPQKTTGFYTYWVRKESVLKATGEGLTIPLPHIRVTDPRQPPRLLSSPHAPGLTCTMFDLEQQTGYVAALTVLHAGETLPRPVIREARTLWSQKWFP